jgi:hypothetical protein
LPDLFYSKESKEKADSLPLPLPPNLGRKIQAQNGKQKKKKIQSRKIMYQQNFIQSNLKKYVGTKRRVPTSLLGYFYIT